MDCAKAIYLNTFIRNFIRCLYSISEAFRESKRGSRRVFSLTAAYYLARLRMRSTHSLFSRHICCYLHIVQLQKQWLGNTIQLSKAVLDCTDCVMSQRNTSPVQQIQINLLFSVVCFLEQVRSSSEVWVQRNISKYRDALVVHELADMQMLDSMREIDIHRGFNNFGWWWCNTRPCRGRGPKAKLKHDSLPSS